MKKILAWYFSDESRTLRYGDGRHIELGIEHTVKGYPEPCEYGLHGCERIIDSLGYAPGAIVWRVELSGRIKQKDDKIAATRRKYVAGGIDVSDVLRRFAREQALSVVHLWDCPDVVKKYLKTGDELIRDAARAAARDAARDAAWDAAWAAARDAARDAAWVAAWDAARDAAWAAARDAARDAANKKLESMIMEAINAQP